LEAIYRLDWLDRGIHERNLARGSWSCRRGIFWGKESRRLGSWFREETR